MQSVAMCACDAAFWLGLWGAMHVSLHVSMYVSMHVSEHVSAGLRRCVLRTCGSSEVAKENTHTRRRLHGDPPMSIALRIPTPIPAANADAPLEGVGRGREPESSADTGRYEEGVWRGGVSG